MSRSQLGDGQRPRQAHPDGRPGATRRSQGRRAAVVAASVALLALVSATGRLSAAEPGPVTFHSTITSRVRLPGTATIAWPAGGTAAVDVAGFGSVGTSGGTTPVPIASITKVMTALVVLRDHPLEAGRSGLTVTVTAADAAAEKAEAAAGDSVLPVVAGERLSERQALEALLVPSADNVADLLATADARSVPAFVARMNAEATRLGLHHTHYADASGLDPASVSTAADQVHLAEVAMRIPALAAIVDLPAVTLPVAGTLRNWNSLVGTLGFTGVKTGSTAAAGGGLVFTVRREVDGRSVRITGAVLGQRDGALVPAALAAASALAASVYADITLRTAVPAGTDVAVATDGGRRVVAATRAPLRIVAPAGAVVHVRFRSLHRVVTGRAGQVIGFLSTTGSGPTSRVRVVTASDVGSPTVSWRWHHSF